MCAFIKRKVSSAFHIIKGSSFIISSTHSERGRKVFTLYENALLVMHMQNQLHRE